MRAWSILGYTYLADHHCPACTVKARDAGALRLRASAATPRADQHGLAATLADREGNLIHPVFASDEPPLDDEGRCLGVQCGDCGAEIVAPDPETAVIASIHVSGTRTTRPRCERSSSASAS